MPRQKRERGERRVACRKCKQRNMKAEKRPSSTLFMHYACMYLCMTKLGDSMARSLLLETVMHLDSNDMRHKSDEVSACEGSIAHELL